MVFISQMEDTGWTFPKHYMWCEDCHIFWRGGWGGFGGLGDPGMLQISPPAPL